MRAITPATIAAATLAAYEVHRWDLGDWRTYHAMLAAQLLAGFALLTWGWVARRKAIPAPMDTAWTVGVLWVAILFALRGIDTDPSFPWWTVMGLIGASTLSAGLATWTGQRRYLFLAVRSSRCYHFHLVD